MIRCHWMVWVLLVIFLRFGFTQAQDKTSSAALKPEPPDLTTDSTKVSTTDSVNHYQPLTDEIELINPSRMPLLKEYVGDKFLYSDSLINGYAWMPEFTTLKTNEEKMIFARAYLWIRQNEILARHGYVFNQERVLQSYFESQPWYKPNPDFKAEMLILIEMQNYWKLINRQADFQPQPSDTLR